MMSYVRRKDIGLAVVYIGLLTGSLAAVGIMDALLIVCSCGAIAAALTVTILQVSADRAERFGIVSVITFVLLSSCLVVADVWWYVLSIS